MNQGYHNNGYNTDFNARLKRINSRKTYTVDKFEDLRQPKRKKTDRTKGGGAFFLTRFLLVIVACLVGFRTIASLMGNPDIDQRRAELAAGDIEGQIGAAILGLSMIADPYLEPVLSGKISLAKGPDGTWELGDLRLNTAVILPNQ